MLQFEGIAKMLSAQFQVWGGKELSNATIRKANGHFAHSQFLIEDKGNARYLIKVLPVNKEAVKKV